MFGNPCKLLGNANTALWIERGQLLLDCRPTSCEFNYQIHPKTIY